MRNIEESCGSCATVSVLMAIMLAAPLAVVLPIQRLPKEDLSVSSMYEQVLMKLSSQDKSMFNFFTKNTGQLENDRISYYSALGDMQIAFATGSVYYAEAGKLGAIVEVRFDNSNAVAPRAQLELSHRSNYFIGNDPAGWRTNVPSYREVLYENLYEGIDVLYRATSNGVERRFAVQSGASLEHVSMTYIGAEDLRVSDGRVMVRSASWELVDFDVFSDAAGGRLSCDPVLSRPMVVKFTCQESDGVSAMSGDQPRPNRPYSSVMNYSTFVGAGDADDGWGIALDPSLNVYVTGRTASSAFPITSGAYDETYNQGTDAFIFKLRPDPSGPTPDPSDMIYSTFVGGRSYDSGVSITADSSGYAYVIGLTHSDNFPTTSGAWDRTVSANDCYVLKLNQAGNGLVYSTILGGNGNDCGTGSSIALDSANRAFVTGQAGNGFPVTANAYDRTFNGGTYDAFVTILNSVGSALDYSSYLGGSGAEAVSGTSIAVDASSGFMFITGDTVSTNFPTTANAISRSRSGPKDAFVTVLDQHGGVSYSTYYGGSGLDYGGWGRAIVIESSQYLYITGNTTSPNLPMSPTSPQAILRGPSDAFIVKIDWQSGGPVWSTYWGGSSWDYGAAITLSPGQFSITGGTSSSDFPVGFSPIDGSFNGYRDVFVSSFSRDINSMSIWSTYLGGTSDDYGASIVSDSSCRLYLTGLTASPDYPTTNGAYDVTFNGNRDAFVTKIFQAEWGPCYPY